MKYLPLKNKDDFGEFLSYTDGTKDYRVYEDGKYRYSENKTGKLTKIPEGNFFKKYKESNIFEIRKIFNIY